MAKAARDVERYLASEGHIVTDELLALRSPDEPVLYVSSTNCRATFAIPDTPEWRRAAYRWSCTVWAEGISEPATAQEMLEDEGRGLDGGGVLGVSKRRLSIW